MRLSRIWWCGAVLLLVACAPLRPVEPEVNLLDLRVTDLTLSHANLLAQLRIFNPNRTAVRIESVSYQLFLNDIPISDGQSLSPVRIAAGEYGTMDLRLSIPYLSLLRFSAGLRPEEKIRYSMSGAVRVGGPRIMDFTFPFKWDGAFAVRDLLTPQER